MRPRHKPNVRRSRPLPAPTGREITAPPACRPAPQAASRAPNAQMRCQPRIPCLHRAVPRAQGSDNQGDQMGGARK
jgi:hypothetical protein